jgi:outer membrane protein assembly factor BamD
VPRRIAIAAALLSSLTLVLVLGACGGKGGSGKVEYSVTAEENYQRGMKKLGDEDWLAARKYFKFIKARFPYSKYAVLAELRTADAEFGAGAYLQAIDSYKLFIKFHPTHDMVTGGYCRFRIGEAFYKMLPDDWWILPPSHEKDQSTTSDAHQQIRAFVDQYGKTPFAPKAKKMLSTLDHRLAAHEWYVAKFYWDRGKPMGTVLRLRRLLSKHAGVGYDAEALWLLGRAYVKTGMTERAKKTWKRLIRDFPKHKRAAEARGRLQSPS